MTSNVDTYAQMKLKKVLDDDSEFERLTSIFDSHKNEYGFNVESEILDTLTQIALTGTDTKPIQDVNTLKAYAFAALLFPPA